MKALLLVKDYEDDFDDYDEDRSEEGDTEDILREIHFSKTSEIEEIQRAINAENDRICTSLPQTIKNEKQEPVMGMWVGTSLFILNAWVTHTAYE